MPCGSIPAEYAAYADAEDDDCVWDKKEVFDYLGNWEMKVYHNQRSFQSNKYNKARIEKKSTVSSIEGPNESKATGTEFFVNKHKLSDEVDLL